MEYEYEYECDSPDKIEWDCIELIVNSELPSIPESWVLSGIGDIVDGGNLA